MPAISRAATGTPASAAPRRSPLLARTVLLGACAAGLVGLAALPSAGDGTVTLTATSSASSQVVGRYVALTEPATPHGLTSRTPARATRTRALPAKAAKRTKPKVRVATWNRPSGSGVISAYGMRWGRMHKGIDFGDSYGAPIRAIGDGVVVGVGYQGSESGYGKITIIRHSNGYYSAYAHQSSYSVHVGERVEAGEVIGRVGSTGHVTGPHLHFEIRQSMHSGQVNPRSWLREHGVYL